MENTIVVNRHFEHYDIYIGRGTKWGNPFILGVHGNKQEVINLYKQYAKNNPEIYDNLEELKGKRLGCSCKPSICHGDVLIELLKEKSMKIYNKIIIGIDESYTRTGISIAVDNKLKKVSSIDFKGCKNNTEKRRELSRVLSNIIKLNQNKAKELIIVCERIRTFSKGFLSTNYIKSTGALIATIIDTAYDFDVPVYSVDTRSWKAQIVGTSKGDKNPTIDFVQNLGFDLYVRTNKKGVELYNDDAADSACIALYGFIPKENQKLTKET